jgi:hypothetical protein
MVVVQAVRPRQVRLLAMLSLQPAIDCPVLLAQHKVFMQI